MKVIHIESGLGNQMLSYCELLALKKSNPKDTFYVETIVFDIPSCNDTICQWNGYELEKIFGISTKNIKTLFTPEEWHIVVQKVEESHFWERNWNFAKYICGALNTKLNLENRLPDKEKINYQGVLRSGIIGKLRTRFNNHTRLGATLKRMLMMSKKDPIRNAQILKKELFLKTNSSLYTGHRLLFKYSGVGIDEIANEVLNVFRFPPFQGSKNKKFAAILEASNSVFIHARRGDMLASNGWCYKYGYFKRAVKHIKKKVDHPVFVFFTNTGSIGWCKENLGGIFGLTQTDKVLFVDWNVGEESYRDMQLMAHCKHGIITNSTFGWWGAFFIQNPNKITISPLAEINTTYHC